MRQYRKILREVIGLDDFNHYRDTACVFQGGLLAKKLSGDLLRVAAGGHTDVGAAQKRLREEYGPITVEPIAPGIARRRKPGEIERLTDEIEELTREATEARAAEERRTPLVRAREECLQRIDRLSDEGSRLESAFETLSEGDRLDTEIEATRARIRSLESVERQLDEAFAAFNLVMAREETHPARYPEDFANRASRLEELWARRARIESEAERLASASDDADPAGWRLLMAGAVASTLSIALVALGFTAAGVIGLVAGLGAAGYGHARQRTAQVRGALRQERLAGLATERVDVAERIARQVGDLPDARSLGPDSIGSARREFEREEGDRRLRAEAETGLRQAIDAARRALALHRVEGEGDADIEARSVEVGTAGSSLADRARSRLDEIKEAIATERDERMAPLRLQLNEIARTRFDLPDGVEATVDRVRAARRDRLERFGQAQAELAEIERGLAAEGRVTVSALSLERDLVERRDRLAALEARAVADRHAYEFVGAAYDAFRTTDEERLLAAISEHLDALSAGSLGPMRADDGLDRATVRSGERELPLASPPLSFGQLHAALLAVRMGAADFLAGLGVGLPILIDDPFVHLDERAVADLWTVLCRIAEERQVIVGTQDRLVLDHLGVEADLTLRSVPSVARPPAPSREDADGSEDDPTGPSSRLDDEVLDLWGDS